MKRTKPKQLVLILHIRKGRFVLRGDGEIGTSALTVKGLTALLRKAQFDLTDRDHILMGGSSLDLPEDDGAPPGFRPGPVVVEAIILTLPKTLQAKARKSVLGKI